MLELVWHCGFESKNNRMMMKTKAVQNCTAFVLDIKKMIEKFQTLFYSHSIVAGGFEEMSYVTRFTPFTLFIMSEDTFARKS